MKLGLGFEPSKGDLSKHVIYQIHPKKRSNISIYVAIFYFFFSYFYRKNCQTFWRSKIKHAESFSTM